MNILIIIKGFSIAWEPSHVNTIKLKITNQKIICWKNLNILGIKTTLFFFSGNINNINIDLNKPNIPKLFLGIDRKIV